eukprot:TRINITY_DN80698_c0_g1_i1.p1 TRINITY_DN80698_c0_g1~~TRINITY_DN80698_c0_g1_i1.p1  ORF type:complete len:206 (+),score=51.26 TRINITY_DN80698_c0_g1_i1:56-673(+)
MAPIGTPPRTCKCVLVGDVGVGKSWIFKEFSQSQRLWEDPLTTAGGGMVSRYVEVQGSEVDLQLWDTAGEECYNSLSRLFYRDAAIALLVFDVSSRASFAGLARWLTEVREQASEGTICVVVGNKVHRDRSVSADEGRRFAMKHEMLYVETGAKDAQDSAESDLVLKIITAVKLWWIAQAPCMKGKGLKLTSLKEDKEYWCLSCY